MARRVAFRFPCSSVGSGTGAPVLISSRPNHVSSPRHVERSMRFSRTTLSCLFRLKDYGTYRAGATFEAGLTTR